MISAHTNIHSRSAKYRMQRMRFLDELIQATDRNELSLIDLGGTFSFWEMNLEHLKESGRLRRIDIYNLEIKSVKTHRLGEIELCERPGNVTQLSEVADHAYDIAFSNSVMEHVGNLGQQNRFAQEIRRVAPCFMVQTPNRYFPLEPHFYVPFFPFIPLGLRTFLHRRFRLGWFPPESDALKARIECDEIRLLSRHELALLFPEARIQREWACGWVKSYILCGKGTV